MEQGSTSLSTSACNGYGNSMLQPKHRAFLSHSGAQKGFVEQLCVDLERCGCHPFCDERLGSLPIGMNFASLIFEAIEQCDFGVVVLSEDFFTSKWPMLELVALANVRKRKPSFKIVPVFLGISHSQFLDVHNYKRWLSLWHRWVEYDNRIDLKDWANTLQLFDSTNALEYNCELSEMKYRAEIVEAICRLVLPRTRFEDSHIQGRSHLCKVIHEGISSLKYNIPKGALYQRLGSSKVEPRIKFPVTRGMGDKSKRIPLGSYDTLAEGTVAYRVAAFYCKKQKHTGRLDHEGGAYFPIPTLSIDPNLPYEEKVTLVRDQVSKVCAEFEEWKASRNVARSVPGPSFEMPTREGHLLLTSPIQQLGQPLNSGMDSSVQGQGSQLDPSIHNGIDFNNPSCILPVLTKTQHELLDARKQIECLKAEVAQTNYENIGWEVKYSEVERKYSESIGWEVKYSELETKYSELEQKISEVEHENGLLNGQIVQLQSPLQTLLLEQEFDPNIFLMEHEESLTR